MPILSYEILSWSCQLNSRYQVNSVNPQRHVFLLPFSLSHWRYFSLTRISYWPISSVSVSTCSALQTAIIVGFSYFLSVFLDRHEAANVKEGKIFFELLNSIGTTSQISWNELLWDCARNWFIASLWWARFTGELHEGLEADSNKLYIGTRNKNACCFKRN